MIPHWLAFSLVYLIYFLDAYSELDPDFGWHIKSGEQILKYGIPSHDIFTFTASNFPWIGHEWFSDILVYLIHTFGGYLLLSMIFAGLWTVSIKIATGKASGVIAIIASISTIQFSGVRSLTWTVLAVAVLIWTLRNKSKKYLEYIPFIFLIWSNIHGSFVIGFVIVLYYAWLNKSIKLIYLLPLCVLATLFNPYGVNVYVEIFRTLTDSTLRVNINEWGILIPNQTIILYPILWLTGYIYFYKKEWKYVANLSVILLFLGLSSMRMYPIFVIVSLFDFYEFSKKFTTELRFNKNKSAKFIIITLGFIFVIAPLLIYLDEIKNIKFDRDSKYTPAIAKYIVENPCKGNMFNMYDFGGYLIWKSPNQKVYIDGRMPSWSLNDFNYMETYKKVLRDTDFRKKEFDKFNITCAVLTKNANIDSKLRQELLSEGWKTASSDISASLLIKQ